MQEEKKTSTESESFEISDNGFEKYSRLMKKNQKFGIGIVFGIIAMIVGIIVWTGTMLLISYKLDWMALGVALLIGYSIRFFGKGVEPRFGITGAILAFIGSITGNLFTACIMFARGVKNHSFLLVVSQLNPGTAFYFLKAVIGPFDVIFCLGAMFIAYYFAFKPIKEK